MVDHSLQRMEIFLKIGKSPLQDLIAHSKVKVFICTCRLFYVNSNKVHIMCVKRSPRIMHAWERMRNFIILERICRLKG